MKKSKGLMIVFLGTDGSGKTSIIDKLEIELNKRGINKNIEYYHWRPGVVVKKKDANTNIKEPHDKLPYGKLKSYLKFMIINIDYTLGYLLKIKSQIKSGKIVVFDRYYYDYYLDKLRYRLNISDYLIKLFQYIIPTPDKAFLLIGSPENIYERKKEISIEEVKKQVNTMKKIKNVIPNSKEINVDDSLDKVINNICKEIIHIIENNKTY